MPVTPLNYQIVSRASAPDDLPVTISEARSYVVLGDETDRDAVLRGLIVTARDWIEDVARTCLVDTVVSEKFQWFPCGQFARLPLCREPVLSITSTASRNPPRHDEPTAGPAAYVTVIGHGSVVLIVGHSFPPFNITLGGFKPASNL
jgi:hypothetical protein